MGLQQHIPRGAEKFCRPPQEPEIERLTNLRPQGARAKARSSPPARFNSLRSEQTVNQEQRPTGNTLLAQRYPTSGNSYFWQTAGQPDWNHHKERKDKGLQAKINR